MLIVSLCDETKPIQNLRERKQSEQMSSIEETEPAQERQGSPPQQQQQQQQQMDTQIKDQCKDNGKVNTSPVENNEPNKNIDRAMIEMSDKGSIKTSDRDSIKMSDKILNRGSKETFDKDNHRDSFEMSDKNTKKDSNLMSDKNHKRDSIETFYKNNKRSSNEMFDKTAKRESSEMSEFRSKKLRRSIILTPDRYECVTCRTPFEFSQDLLEHLSGNPAGKSGNSENNRKQSCFVRECFMCDFAPAAGNADLVEKYRALQDHVITTHFKVSC